MNDGRRMDHRLRLEQRGRLPSQNISWVFTFAGVALRCVRGISGA
jgi:hypothetical protein